MASKKVQTISVYLYPESFLTTMLFSVMSFQPVTTIICEL